MPDSMQSRDFANLDAWGKMEPDGAGAMLGAAAFKEEEA
jgi:hypothetical protein